MTHAYTRSARDATDAIQDLGRILQASARLMAAIHYANKVIDREQEVEHMQANLTMCESCWSRRLSGERDSHPFPADHQTSHSHGQMSDLRQVGSPLRNAEYDR